MHVDGFRFDLAPELAREDRSFDKLSPFFDVLLPGPGARRRAPDRRAVGRRRGGYEVGNFPVELVGVERHATATPCASSGAASSRQIGDLATRLTGSSDLYGDDGRRPSASINFVTVPRRLHAARPGQLQRQAQRGQRRGQPRRDQRQRELELRRRRADRRPGVRALRERQKRNFVADAAASARACRCCRPATSSAARQGGNNNAYCQDNELTWLDWDLDDERRAFLEFAKRLTRLRADEPVFRRRHFFQGRPIQRRASRTSTGSTRRRRR